MNPYEELANAIVLQAVKDYRQALQALSLYPSNTSAQSQRWSIEHFFRSEWFSVLTQIDPEMLIHKLKAEVGS